MVMPCLLSRVFSLLLLSALSACGIFERPYTVDGAAFLDRPEAFEDTTWEVLQRPLVSGDVDFLLARIDAVAMAGAAYPGFWDEVGAAANSMQAMRSHPLWKRANVPFADFVAVFIKANFVQEHLLDPVELEELRANREFLDKASEIGAEDFERAATLAHLDRLIAVVEGLREAGSFELYRANRVAIDTALDRFKAIGEQ